VDQLMKEYINGMPTSLDLGAIDLILSLTISTLMSLAIAVAYSRTHEGYSYSKTYVQSIVLVSLIITLIMLIIGSNIARAFALVGAMSIVRFRNPMKDPRDLVFIFASIAVGMAAGTQFYAFAILFTLIFCGLIIAFKLTNFGAFKSDSYILKLILEKPHMQNDIYALLERLNLQYQLISAQPMTTSTDSTLIIEIEASSKSANEAISLIQDELRPKDITILRSPKYIGA